MGHELVPSTVSIDGMTIGVNEDLFFLRGNPMIVTPKIGVLFFYRTPKL